MRFINVRGLKLLGSGYFGRVYRLSPRRVIKVYDCGCEDDPHIMSEEVEMSMISEHALPVLDVVIAIERNKHYYAVIKKYLPHNITWDEGDQLYKNLPKKLRWDCGSSNARKDYNGKVFLIDTQGDYALDCCLGGSR
jgi:hypothetical protein